MLAYVFWHNGRGEYDDALRALHASLAATPPPGFRGSITYARARQPWFDGYEDWYLVDDWAALGALNDAAARRPGHDDAARASIDGAGAVYGLTAGTPDLANLTGATWSDDPVDGEVTWRRELVLGPAPQYCAHHRSGARSVV